MENGVLYIYFIAILLSSCAIAAACISRSRRSRSASSLFAPRAYFGAACPRVAPPLSASIRIHIICIEDSISNWRTAPDISYLAPKIGLVLPDFRDWSVLIGQRAALAWILFWSWLWDRLSCSFSLKTVLMLVDEEARGPWQLLASSDPLEYCHWRLQSMRCC